MLTIEHISESDLEFFKAVEHEKTIGKMTYYREEPATIVIDDTQVDEDQEGSGIGTKLILAAVEYARSSQLRIIPLCPFVKAVFERRTDIQDVWNR